MRKLALLASVCLALPCYSLPTTFDLRDVSGKKLVSAVKSQSGGTCWTHGTMAAIEGNLLLTGAWNSNGETGEPNLAEYHLDWWNGFNRNYNADIAPTTAGLTVHEGGDYRVAAAYLARGGGVVRDSDGQSFSNAPSQTSANYHYYFVRDIEWFDSGPNLENIDQLKQAITENGVMGTALTWSSSYYNSSKNTFYQPASSTADPNHAVAIVGWDDGKITQASKPGAWLAKNSWGSDWGQGGYFWISYYDKITGHHPQMGAVSFKNTEPMHFNQVYTHDYHGWRDTKAGVTQAVNKFIGKGSDHGRELLKSVGFYTAADNVEYSVKVYNSFDGTQLTEMLSIKDGIQAHQGFHTVDLNFPVVLAAGDDFYISVELSSGGHPFDKTSDVPVLLGGGTRTIVESKANAGESYYLTASGWKDLTKDEASANFCIKGFSTME